MPRIAIGTPVEVDGLRGVVVGHRPQGMVDVQPEGEDFIIRKRESALRRLNPKRSKKAKKTVSRRSEVHRQHIEKTPKASMHSVRAWCGAMAAPSCPPRAR